jgi:hypothetical protein
MGQEQNVLPPPTGTPVVPPRVGLSSAAPAPPVPPPPAPPLTPPPVAGPPGGPQLGRQDRGKGGAHVGDTVSRRQKPLVEVVHQRRGSGKGWFKVVASWVLLGAVVVAGVKLYPRVKEQLTLDSAKVTASPDGYRIADGPVSWRAPGRPHKILVHLAGESAGLTGFRMTTESGTLDVDVKNTVSPRTPTALQRFCDVQFEHRTATLGPAISDTSTFDEGIYRRTASWHEGEKFVMATCLGHSHSNVFIEGTSIHARWAPYAQAVETADIAS